MDPLDVSIVIPLYNEAESLPTLAREIDDALEPLNLAYEVLFVDDGSTDTSLSVLRDLEKENGRRRVLHLARNGGQSAALAAGLDVIRAPVAVTLDADLQNDPADIPLLLQELEECDMVTGVRARRKDTWVRRTASRVANAVRSRLLADDTPDTGCSLKAFRVDALARIPRFDGMHRFLPALVRMDGGRLKNVPVRHRKRVHGATKYTVGGRLRRSLADLFGVYWLQRRWIHRRPLMED